LKVPQIQTARLLLRGYTEADIPDLVTLLAAREVVAMTLRIPHPYTEQHAIEFVENSQEGDDARFAIVLRESGRLCGGIGLRVEPQHEHAELGYWIGVPYWGNGYASEAAEAVVRFGFEELRLHRMVASVFAGNEASKRILLKLGMRYEGCLREHYVKWGEFLDSELYALLANEWRERKPRA
jgi:RimJ/RimL family protein N-acetyltransferase